jgi:hypothetical protein
VKYANVDEEGTPVQPAVYEDGAYRPIADKRRR